MPTLSPEKYAFYKKICDEIKNMIHENELPISETKLLIIKSVDKPEGVSSSIMSDSKYQRYLRRERKRRQNEKLRKKLERNREKTPKEEKEKKHEDMDDTDVYEQKFYHVGTNTDDSYDKIEEVNKAINLEINNGRPKTIAQNLLRHMEVQNRMKEMGKVVNKMLVDGKPGSEKYMLTEMKDLGFVRSYAFVVKTLIGDIYKYREWASCALLPDPYYKNNDEVNSTDYEFYPEDFHLLKGAYGKTSYGIMSSSTGWYMMDIPGEIDYDEDGLL